MTANNPPSRLEDIGACGMLLWGGLTIGVAFIATPVKFMAPSLTLPVALDVGRHTFAIYNRTELVIVAILALIAFRGVDRRFLRALLVPAAIVLLEAIWLIPALDKSVVAFIAGKSPLPSSPLHSIYIAVEIAKTVLLVILGGRLVMTRKA